MEWCILLPLYVCKFVWDRSYFIQTSLYLSLLTWWHADAIIITFRPTSPSYLFQVKCFRTVFCLNVSIFQHADHNPGPGRGYSHTWPDGMCRSLNKVSFAVKIMRQGIVICKKIMRRVSQAKIFFLFCFWEANFLCDRVCLWQIFFETGFRVRWGFPHTPVTFLVQYPPGSSGPFTFVEYLWCSAILLKYHAGASSLLRPLGYSNFKNYVLLQSSDSMCDGKGAPNSLNDAQPEDRSIWIFGNTRPLRLPGSQYSLFNNSKVEMYLLSILVLCLLKDIHPWAAMDGVDFRFVAWTMIADVIWLADSTLKTLRCICHRNGLCGKLMTPLH